MNMATFEAFYQRAPPSSLRSTKPSMEKVVCNEIWEIFHGLNMIGCIFAVTSKKFDCQRTLNLVCSSTVIIKSIRPIQNVHLALSDRAYHETLICFK